LSSVGIKVEYGEPLEEGKNRGRRGSTIGDREHSELIEMYCSGLSMNKINKQTGRSTKSIKDYIDAHNASVERSGFCPSCRRVRSKREGERAVCA
jgi:molybdenum cofactor biosynthesis enzyme MoaA